MLGSDQADKWRWRVDGGWGYSVVGVTGAEEEGGWGKIKNSFLVLSTHDDYFCK